MLWRGRGGPDGRGARRGRWHPRNQPGDKARTTRQPLHCRSSRSRVASVVYIQQQKYTPPRWLPLAWPQIVQPPFTSCPAVIVHCLLVLYWVIHGRGLIIYRELFCSSRQRILTIQISMLLFALLPASVQPQNKNQGCSIRGFHCGGRAMVTLLNVTINMNMR